MSTDGAEVWTVVRLLNWTKEYFARADVSDARLAAEVLLAHVLECRRIDLYARYDYRPDQAQLGAYRGLVTRATAHEPVAYLVGQKEFYSLTFKVTPDVLIPRAETEILVAEAVEHLRSLARPAAAWDACTGSGCVAIAVARNVPDATVLATDISAEALAVARGNGESLGVSDRVRFREAALLDRPADDGEPEAFDAITANPPYVADGDPLGESVAYEPQLALRAGADGLDCIRPIVECAHALLRPGGALILEFGYTQAGAVRDLLAAAGAYDEPKIIRDHHDIERACVAIRR